MSDAPRTSANDRREWDATEIERQMVKLWEAADETARLLRRLLDGWENELERAWVTRLESAVRRAKFAYLMADLGADDYGFLSGLMLERAQVATDGLALGEDGGAAP